MVKMHLHIHLHLQACSFGNTQNNHPQIFHQVELYRRVMNEMKRKIHVSGQKGILETQQSWSKWPWDQNISIYCILYKDKYDDIYIYIMVYRVTIISTDYY